ncbi:MAG: hypothetical protein RLZZ595_2139 [Bacteroidota bacterium]
MHMRSHIIFNSITLALFFSASAQTQFGKSANVTRDTRVDVLVDKQIELNGQAIKGRTTIEQGFRLLIVSTNKRDLALDTKSRLLKNYPDQKSYMFYQSPNFKVQFGNFKSYKDAEKAKLDLELDFGKDILIIPSRVEIRVEKEMEDNQ